MVDCGSGSGYMCVELAIRGAIVITCDLTLKSLIRVKRTVEVLNIGNRVALVCCSAEELPLKTGIADVFILNAVLEHLPKEGQTIDEISRVSKCHSTLLVTVPILYRYHNSILVPINAIHDRKIGHLRRHSVPIIEGNFHL